MLRIALGLAQPCPILKSVVDLCISKRGEAMEYALSSKHDDFVRAFCWGCGAEVTIFFCFASQNMLTAHTPTWSFGFHTQSNS